MNKIEQEIQAKGLTAPRITPEDIAANIVSATYFTGADGMVGAAFADTGMLPAHDAIIQPMHLLTFCVLVMKNGFTVVGKSACASPENFDVAIGRQIAYRDAVEQIWPLMGYELRSKLAGL